MTWREGRRAGNVCFFPSFFGGVVAVKEQEGGEGGEWGCCGESVVVIKHVYV